MLINKEHELRALEKALYFLKFQCVDEDARKFAGSPIINQILDEISKEVNIFNKQRGAIINNNRFIENIPECLDAVKKHIKNTNEWNSLSDDIRELHIKTLIQPLDFNIQTIQELMSFGNLIHSNI